MSAIERFQAAKRIAERVRENYVHGAGLDKQNDKAVLACRFGGMQSDRVADFHFEARYGYYGHSSSYPAIDEPTAKYVAKAITEVGKDIMRRAAEMAEADAETARKRARDEAREVLTEVEP